MLEIQYTNHKNREFVIKLEHSLFAISKWEEVFKKPFLVPNNKLPYHELIYYYDCMITESDILISEILYDSFADEAAKEAIVKLIDDYMNENRTATTIKKKDELNEETMITTSEVLYAYIAAAQLDFQVQYWHISRLLILLGVIGELNTPKEKKTMSYDDRIQMQAKLNEERKKKLNSKG